MSKPSPDSLPPDQLPYLELGDEPLPSESPPAKQRNETLSHTILPLDDEPGSPFGEPNIPALITPRTPWWHVLWRVSPTQLILLSSSLLVIMLLLPQLSYILRGFLIEVVMLFRVLLIPALAVIGSLWLIRLFFYQRRL